MAGLVDVNGTELWLDDRPGPEPPVVLIHAGWTTSAAWDGVLAGLAGDYRTVRYDNRGYGHSPAPVAAFTWHDDLVAVLDHLAIERAILVGHSGGGAAALSLTLGQPQRVERLVLVAPGIAGYPWPRTEFGSRFVTLYTAGDRAGLVELGLRTWAAADQGPAARALIEGAVDAMLAIGEHQQDDPPAFDRLAEITTPTRILLGDRDDPMVIECARAAARLPHASLTTVAAADHLLPLHYPDLVVAAIRHPDRQD
ncbi:MAG TPA: alpha/beta hydrolase [Pseudonocardiaceae bacterium]|nr:alpha/beta hydrolase [Pseudonocardiaceae bacterium]